MRLLVSVRNELEAGKALRGGCDILDIKEPSHGSLGRSDSRVVHNILANTPSSTPVSAAMGEFSEMMAQTSPFNWRADLKQSHGLSYIKAGTSGLRKIPNWKSRIRAFDWGTRWVCVLYADYRNTDSPDPEELFELARDLHASGLLIDTFDKRGGRLFQRMSPREVHQWRERTRESGMFLALAGSLRLEDLETIVEISPDIVAVRGAVCGEGRRTGEIDESLVHVWKERITQCNSQTATGLEVR